MIEFFQKRYSPIIKSIDFFFIFFYGTPYSICIMPNRLIKKNFTVHSLPPFHREIISPYLPFINKEFHHLFQDIYRYDQPPFIHAFIFTVWFLAQFSICPKNISISPYIASFPFHSILFFIRNV